MQKLVVGLAMMTFLYFVVLWTAFTMYHVIFQTPFDHNWDQSGMFIGIWMVTIPYLILGFTLRYFSERPVREAFQISLLTLVCERVSIYLIGYYYASHGYGNPEPLQFIRGEAAPYYTPAYIFAGGIISVLLAMGVARIRVNKANRV